jgi:uncharacterized protein YcbK (DUF882 family)
MRPTSPSPRILAALASSIATALVAPPLVAQSVAGPDAGPPVTVPATPAASSPASAAPDARYAQLPELTFRAVNTREDAHVRIYRPDGTVDPDVRTALGWLFRDLATGAPSPVVPRTLQLLVRVATHFNATRVDVVSAYRTGLAPSGRRVRREGYHSVGSAVDFVLPGQDMAVVAAYARTFAHVGVGWYPREGFVHLDSREQTFFWENRSRRHHHGWDRPLERVGTTERDAAWTPANDAPWDAPGAAPALVVHPRTQPGAHPPRHHHGHHGHRSHPPLEVFHGAT